MYNYKVGDKFRWRKEVCFDFEEEYFFNDIYELAKKGNNGYYIKTIYSEENGYGDLDNNSDNVHSYEEICKHIDRDLEKIED